MERISSKQLKSVFALALPMAASRFIQMLSGFIGMIMLAHLGHQVLAACALINATLSTIMLIFIAIIFAVSLVVGQTFGEKKYQQIGSLVQQGCLLSFFLGLIMMAAFWFADDFARWFHQLPVMIAYIRQYFHALMWAAVPIMLQACLEQFCYGILKQRLVIIINLVSLAIAIPIAYTLIFGRFGFPKLGVAGLAYTFAIQSVFDLLLLTLSCYYLKDFQKFYLFKRHIHHGWEHAKKILRIGWPMSLQFGGELLAFFVIGMMTGWLGTNALAAVQVTQQWLFLVIVPIFAMSEAAGILVGHAVGAKQYDQLRSIGNASIFLTIGTILFLDTAFLLFPDFFASFYINVHNPANAQSLHLIHILFIILTITLILDGLRDITSGLLRGLYDTQFPMRIGLMVMWFLVVPLGYLLAFTFKMDVIGFKIGGNIGLFIGAVIVYWRWISKIKKYGTAGEPQARTPEITQS